MSGRFRIEVVMATAAALGVSMWGTQSTAPAVLSEPASGLYRELAAARLEQSPVAASASGTAHGLTPSAAEDPLWSCGGWQGPTPFQRAVLHGSVAPLRNVENGAANEPVVYAYAGKTGNK